MEVVKQRLTEAGVIGGIVDDFNPLCKLDVIYGDKRISLGDHVSPAQVQHRPHDFEYRYDPAQSELMETFRNPTLIIVVMTDPDAVGGEYLHWLTTHVMAAEQIIEMPSEDLISYEAPRAGRMGTGNIVFTVFKQPDESLPNIIIPHSRNNFSTRDFASINALGDPVAAAFFNIIDAVGNGYH